MGRLVLMVALPPPGALCTCVGMRHPMLTAQPPLASAARRAWTPPSPCSSPDLPLPMLFP